MSPVPSVTPFPPSSSQSHWQMELVMGVGRALLSGVPRDAGLGAEMGAWDAAGVLGPTLTLAGSWQPQICLLLVRTPNPILSAPLVMWGRAALAHRAHHGCESPTAPALLSFLGMANLALGAALLPPWLSLSACCAGSPCGAARWWESWACHPQNGHLELVATPREFAALGEKINWG